MTIMDRLAHYLESKSIKRKDLAAALRLSPSTLSSWFVKGEDMPADYVYPTAQFLGIRPEWILTGEGDPVNNAVQDELEPDVQYLVDTFNQLDYEGKTYVTGIAISELRRVKAKAGERDGMLTRQA